MKLKKALLTLACSTLAATAQLKVATVNVGELFDGYYKTEETQKVITAERAKLQAESESMLKKVQELKKKHDSLRANLDDPALPQDKKVELLKQFEEVRQQGTQMERQRVETVQRKNTALNEKASEDARVIFGEISEEIKVVAEAEGYDLILNQKVTGQRGVPVFIYAKDSLDITAKVKEKLSAKAPK